MKIGDKTIEYLAGIITWDLQVTKYKTWPQLIFYFKNFWFEDQYWKDFPARIVYCREKITSLNNILAMIFVVVVSGFGLLTSYSTINCIIEHTK